MLSFRIHLEIVPLVSTWVRVVSTTDSHTFYQAQSLNHGEDWKKRIIKEIKNSSNFLFLATPNSIQSDACKHEIGIALGNDIPIIPILYGIDSSELPDWISDFHGVKVEKDNIEDLRRCLAGLKNRKGNENRITILVLIAAIMGLTIFIE